MSDLLEEHSEVAIVILNWNGKSYLEKFLPSIVENSTLPFVKIYIADNGSTDESINFLKENYPQFGLIVFDKNYGFTGGYNRALSMINAEYFVLLNSDVEVTPNWIQPVITFMDENTNVAACQPKIRAFNNKDYFEYAGAAGGFIDKYGYPFCRGRILKVYEKDTGQYDDVKSIFWTTGACMFVRAELFKMAEGLDEDFFAHMEEIDLCWRFKNMGYKVYYIPQSTVFHVGGGTLPNNNPGKLYLNYRNNLFMLFKNLPSEKRFQIVFKRMVLDGLSAMVFLLNFSFAFFWAVVKAHYSFYSNLGVLREKRKHLAKLNNSYKHEEIYSQSIVWSFFIRKVRKFSELFF